MRNGVLGGFRSIYRDRPRGVYTADEQEPNALVQIGAEPMLRATLVELEDGLEAAPLAGKGRLVAVPAAAVDAMHAHCDVLVVGGGRSGLRGGGRAQPAVCSCSSRGRRATRACSTRTTAVGLYDGNYVLAVERGRRAWHIRAKRIVLATGALERPASSPTTTRRA